MAWALAVRARFRASEYLCRNNRTARTSRRTAPRSCVCCQARRAKPSGPPITPNDFPLVDHASMVLGRRRRVKRARLWTFGEVAAKSPTLPNRAPFGSARFAKALRAGRTSRAAGRSTEPQNPSCAKAAYPVVGSSSAEPRSPSTVPLSRRHPREFHDRHPEAPSRRHRCHASSAPPHNAA
jgi:hypothetical protein